MKVMRIYRTPIVREQLGSRTLQWPQCTELSEAGCFNLVKREQDFAVVAIESEFDPRGFLSLPEFADTKLLDLPKTEQFIAEVLWWRERERRNRVRRERDGLFRSLSGPAGPDDFNRSSLGANWTTITNCTALSTKSSLYCMADGDPEGSYWNASSPAGGNYYSQITLVTPVTSSSGKGMGPAVRINSGTAGNMYFVQVNTNASERMQMWEVTGGGSTYNNIAGSTAVVPAAGNTARLTINGTSLTFALAGTDRITQSDNTLTATGTWGIFGASASEDYCDDFIGDDLVTAGSGLVIPRFRKHARFRM